MMPFLILHGWGSCAKNWQEVKDGLEKNGHRVYLPDLPGFGKNPKLERIWLIEDYLYWLEQYCEKNNLAQFFLLGHSFGGGLAVKFSLRYPKRIKKMFLVSPALIRRKTLKKEIIKKAAKAFSFLPISLKKIIYGRIIKSDYPLQQGPARETYLNIIKEDLSGILSEVSVETVLFWGEKDKITPLKEAYIIKENIPGAKIEIIPGVKHSPHLEAPKNLIERILRSIKL